MPPEPPQGVSRADEREVRRELATAEAGLWWVVAICPLLWLLNGPPITSDQAVVQAGLFALAVAGGVVLRLVKASRAKSTRGAVERSP